MRRLRAAGAPPVSIRAPARGATRSGSSLWRRAWVSIRAPARGATGSRCTWSPRAGGFNPRPCARGDGAREVARRCHDRVSIRAPARGATGQDGWGGFRAEDLVSIRAPARGATVRLAGEAVAVGPVSIRAPARGATKSSQRLRKPLAKFQSAPLREGRHSRRTVCGTSATGFNPRPCARGDGAAIPSRPSSLTFQSAPLREGRLVDTTTAREDLEFQSAPLREGRPTTGTGVATVVGFNPRPCARGDRNSSETVASTFPSSFNPRPCARGDRAISAERLKPDAFQSAPLREGRHGRISAVNSRRVAFQSAPLREGRLGDSASCRCWGGRFNPRPCARGDSFSPSASIGRSCFNPRPCARGDPSIFRTLSR